MKIFISEQGSGDRTSSSQERAIAWENGRGVEKAAQAQAMTLSDFKTALRMCSLNSSQSKTLRAASSRRRTRSPLSALLRRKPQTSSRSVR